VWDKVVRTHYSKLILAYSDEVWFLLTVDNYKEVWKAAMRLRDLSDMSPIEAKGTGKEKHRNKKEMDMCVVMLINIVV
jgi:hypothetical protein